MKEIGEEILRKASLGDEEAFSFLVEAYIDHIYTFVVRMLRDTAMAEDVVQETFIKVWKNIKKFRVGENFKAWLFAIARNTTIDATRKKKTFPFSQFENDRGENILTEILPDASPLADELLQLQLDQHIIDNAVDDLPLYYQEVLVLHYKEELTFEEIGTIVGRPLNTVKSQYRRAVLLLKDKLTVLAPNTS